MFVVPRENTISPFPILIGTDADRSTTQPVVNLDEIADAAIVQCPSELMCEAITKASDMACVIQSFAGITKEQLHDRTL